MNDKMKAEIFEFFKQTQPVYLSTVDGNKPRVRPVTLIYFNESFWIATGSEDAKVSQLFNNANIEFCLPIKDDKNMGYIRVAGIAEIVENISEKQLILKNIDFIKYFWKEADDPGYALLRIEMQEIEYLPIGQMLATRMKV